MSTRGIIARKTATGFEGRYHHFDAYPDGLGQTLYDAYNGHFNKDAKAMMVYLIDEHPAGWSTINDCDLSLEPGFIEHAHEDSASSRPRCYCHGDRHEKGQGYFTDQDKDTWCEYAIDEATSHMFCYSFEYQQKQWVQFAEIDLNGEAPKWDSLEDEEETEEVEA